MGWWTVPYSSISDCRRTILKILWLHYHHSTGWSRLESIAFSETDLIHISVFYFQIMTMKTLSSSQDQVFCGQAQILFHTSEQLNCSTSYPSPCRDTSGIPLLPPGAIKMSYSFPQDLQSSSPSGQPTGFYPDLFIDNTINWNTIFASAEEQNPVGLRLIPL